MNKVQYSDLIRKSNDTINQIFDNICDMDFDKSFDFPNYQLIVKCIHMAYTLEYIEKSGDKPCRFALKFQLEMTPNGENYYWDFARALKRRINGFTKRINGKNESWYLFDQWIWGGNIQFLKMNIDNERWLHRAHHYPQPNKPKLIRYHNILDNILSCLKSWQNSLTK